MILEQLRGVVRHNVEFYSFYNITYSRDNSQTPRLFQGENGVSADFGMSCFLCFRFNNPKLLIVASMSHRNS